MSAIRSLRHVGVVNPVGRVVMHDSDINRRLSEFLSDYVAVEMDLRHRIVVHRSTPRWRLPCIIDSRMSTSSVGGMAVTMICFLC